MISFADLQLSNAEILTNATRSLHLFHLVMVIFEDNPLNDQDLPLVKVVNEKPTSYDRPISHDS